MRTRRCLSDLDLHACRAAIRGEVREETFWMDNTLAEGAVFRERGAALDLRFKRATTRLVIHNWFALSLLEAGPTGTTIVVRENLGVGPAWWIPGLAGGLFFGLFAISSVRFNPLVPLIGSAFVEGMTLLMSAFAAAIEATEDRLLLSSFSARVARIRDEV